MERSKGGRGKGERRKMEGWRGKGGRGGGGGERILKYFYWTLNTYGTKAFTHW